MEKNNINCFLKTKYKDKTDFIVIRNSIYSKTSLSFQTLEGINNINKIKAVYYLSAGSKPYTLGYRIGICLYDND